MLLGVASVGTACLRRQAVLSSLILPYLAAQSVRSFSLESLPRMRLRTQSSGVAML